MVVPKSVTPSRIASNVQGAADFAKRVDKADILILDNVAANGKQKRFIMPPWVSGRIILILVHSSDVRALLYIQPVDLGFDNWKKWPY